MTVSMDNPSVRGFVQKLNERLLEREPESRLEDLKITIHGEDVDTTIRLVPLGVVTSAEKWQRVTEYVENEVTNFAKLFIEEKGRKPSRRGRKTVEENVERERKEFAKALKKGEVTWIDPEDVAG